MSLVPQGSGSIALCTQQSFIPLQNLPLKGLVDGHVCEWHSINKQAKSLSSYAQSGWKWMLHFPLPSLWAGFLLRVRLILVTTNKITVLLILKALCSSVANVLNSNLTLISSFFFNKFVTETEIASMMKAFFSHFLLPFANLFYAFSVALLNGKHCRQFTDY